MLPVASERYLGNGPTGSAWDRENWKPCRVLTTDAILKISFRGREGANLLNLDFAFVSSISSTNANPISSLDVTYQPGKRFQLQPPIRSVKQNPKPASPIPASLPRHSSPPSVRICLRGVRPPSLSQNTRPLAP
jgi:hypothetical protein